MRPRKDEQPRTRVLRSPLALQVSCVRLSLRPDVLLSNRTVVPSSYGHHSCAVAELSDDAGPPPDPNLIGCDVI